MKDTADYVLGLPKAEHSAPEWQAAMEALILVAETGGPAMLVFNPDLKMPHWGKRKLKRDQ